MYLKRIGIYVFVLTIVLLVSGLCMAKTVTITFAGNYYNIPAQSSWFKQVVDKFNHSNSEIQVKLIQGIDVEKLTALSVAGKAPDVVQFDRYKIAYSARAGLFAPLESYLPRSVDLKKDFIPAAIQEATWKGRIYALPMTSDIRGLFWNKRLLQEAGLNASLGPTNWSELNAFAKKLTVRDSNNKVKQAGFVPWSGNWYPYGWIWTFGGDYYDMNSNKPTLDNVKVVEYLKWLEDFSKVIITPQQASSVKLFEGEGQAMQVAHYGAIMTFRNANKKVDSWINGGECPHPSNGKNGTWAGGMCYAIPAGSKNKGPAGKFLAYLATTEVMNSFYDLTREWPPTYQALDNLNKQMEPLENTFMKQLKVANHRRPFTDVLGDYLFQAENLVITGKKSPEAAAKEAQTNALRQHPSLWTEKVVYKVK